VVAEIGRLSYLLPGIEISTLTNLFFITTLFFVLIIPWSARSYLKAETVEGNLEFSDRARR
jgi:membrane protein CcdC involved in cytochrome C biogenesis